MISFVLYLHIFFIIFNISVFYRCKHGGRTKASPNWTQATECLQNWQRLVIYKFLHFICFIQMFFEWNFISDEMMQIYPKRVFFYPLHIERSHISLQEIEVLTQYWSSRFIICVWHYMCNTWRSLRNFSSRICTNLSTIYSK